MYETMDFLSKRYYDPYSETMDDDFFPSLSRPSVIANQDDFDYALELEPDDEYRLVAKTLAEIVGFDDYDHDYESNISSNNSRQSWIYSKTKDEKDINKSQLSINIDEVIVESSDDGPPSLSLSDNSVPRHSLDGSNPIVNLENSKKSKQDSDKLIGLSSESLDSNNSKESSISYQEFLWKMGMMQKQRTWIESVRRRSSLNFQSNVMLSDKQARDRFLVMMSSGVHVRRHQSNHISEMVRLHSSDGSKTLEWSKPRPLDLLRQRQRQGQFLDGSTGAIYATSYDRGGFDCCITICGCGDDLLTGNDSQQKRRTISPQKSNTNSNTSNVLAEVDENRYEGIGRIWHNFGFKFSGMFEDTDIVTIHPATKEDPTHPGMTGTETLRTSKDSYNEMLSFSVVYRRIFSSQGYETLDIECDNQETYFILLRGFYMLREEAEERRLALLQEYVKSQKEKKKGFRGLLELIKSSLYPPKDTIASDPISILFESRHEFDVFAVFLTGPSMKRQEMQSMYPKQQQWLQSEGQKPQLPPAQFLGWNTAGTQIWARLAMTGLDVRPVYSWDLKRIILKIRCPQWRLEEVAEHMHLRLKNRDGTMRRFKVSRRDTFVSLGSDGTIFRSSERQQIIDFIIRSKIKDGGAELDENSSLGRKIIQRFPLHMESRLQDLRHKWIKFWKIEPPGHVALPWSLLSTPIRESIEKMTTTLKMTWRGLLRQPLDHVAEYFGEDIAFYFAFIAFYTRWLIVPSVLGFIVFCCQIRAQTLDYWLCLPYAIAVMIWACFLLAYWRQKSSVFAYRWGVLDYEVEEAERPQFQGRYEYDDSTGEVRKVYPQWKRILKYCLTIPIISVVSFTMLVVMATVFSTQDQLYYDYSHRDPLNYHPRINIFVGVSYLDVPNAILIANAVNSTTSIVAAQISTLRDPWGTHITTSDLTDPDFWIVTFLYPCLYGIVVDIVALIFSYAAVTLNDYENHRTSSIYTNRLILKVFSFQFITVFTSLYYYAFISKKGEASYLRMSVTIFALMTVGQWYSALMDLFVPAIYHRMRKYHRKMSISKINRKVYKAREYLDSAMGWIGIHRLHSSDYAASATSSLNLSISMNNQPSEQQKQAQTQVDKRALLLEQARSRVWEEALLMRYSTFDDYTNLVMQLGFVLLFSIVFPLAPLLLLMNNLILIRLKAVKICYFRQRPIATKVSGMGVWENLLQVMSAAGILTNCGIMAFTSSVLSNSPVGQNLGQSSIILILFAFEHLLLLFKYWLHISIPRIPPAVLRAKNKDRQSAAIALGQDQGKEKGSKHHHHHHRYDHDQKKNRKHRSSMKTSVSIPSSISDSNPNPSSEEVMTMTNVPFSGQDIDESERRQSDWNSYENSYAQNMLSTPEDVQSSYLFDMDVFQQDEDSEYEYSDKDIESRNSEVYHYSTNQNRKGKSSILRRPSEEPHNLNKGVRFSEVGDAVIYLSPIAASLSSHNTSSSRSSDNNSDNNSDHDDNDNSAYSPNPNDVIEEEDRDDSSLSSAESDYDNHAIVRQQQVWGTQAAEELRREEEDAWASYLQQRQQIIQQRMLDLQQRQQEITSQSPSFSPTRSPSRSPTRSPTHPTMTKQAQRSSFLQSITDVMFGYTDKRKSELSLGPLQVQSHMNSTNMMSDRMSPKPMRDSIQIDRVRSKSRSRSPSPQPSYDIESQKEIVIANYEDSGETQSTKRQMISEQQQEQQQSYATGGHISIHSDLYKQAQEDFTKKQQSKQAKSSKPSKQSKETSSKIVNAIASHSPIRRPSPPMTENISRLANLSSNGRASQINTPEYKNLRMRNNLGLNTNANTNNSMNTNIKRSVPSTGPNYSPTKHAHISSSSSLPPKSPMKSPKPSNDVSNTNSINNIGSNMMMLGSPQPRIVPRKSSSPVPHGGHVGANVSSTVIHTNTNSIISPIASNPFYYLDQNTKKIE